MLSRSDLEKYKRYFPFSVQGKACPDCTDAVMTPGYVRAPAVQDHWRGVEALVCENCGYSELTEE